MFLLKICYFLNISILIFFSSVAICREYPIGQPKKMHGMEISVVYLQPVLMEPRRIIKNNLKSDMHLEVDIRALEDNKNGFQEGSWIPYLSVFYEINKYGSSQVTSKGNLIPMVANDGPHYGNNIKLNGPGKYLIKIKICPPNSFGTNLVNLFGRHTDKETGVGEWFQSFEIKYEFIYAGTGKKGGY